MFYTSVHVTMTRDYDEAIQVTINAYLNNGCSSYRYFFQGSWDEVSFRLIYVLYNWSADGDCHHDKSFDPRSIRRCFSAHKENCFES